MRTRGLILVLLAGCDLGGAGKPTDSGSDPDVHVGDTGHNGPQEIAVSADSVDLTTHVGCDVERIVTIRNEGDEALVVNGVTLEASSEEFVLDDYTSVNGDFPWTLPPGSGYDVSVGYAPVDAVADTAVLRVESDDPVTPVAEVALSGTGESYTTNQDTFVSGSARRMDLVFALDTSATMEADWEKLDAAMPTFLDALADADSDYQVAVVTQDDGCVIGATPYVTDGTDRAAQEGVLHDWIFHDAPGTWTEAGFTLLEAALSPANVGGGGCNEGLLREDAYLVVVGVTDDAEQSTRAWSTYVAGFQAIKADPDTFVAHAIAGDYPAGCDDALGGLGWYEASVSSGGLFLSVCEADWDAHLAAIVDAQLGTAGVFALSSWPVPSSLVVTVDGVLATTGWSYREADRSVVFDAAYVPAEGATVQVDYTVDAGCDE
ncbi:MAG: hypothetical protein Q8P41_02415 [Pseudomonadota bacterium]|nr:hypothetical protein [Pseudomonadota bacterium]